MPKSLRSSVSVPAVMLASTEAVIYTIAESVRQLFPLEYVEVDWETFSIGARRNQYGEVIFEVKVDVS